MRVLDHGYVELLDYLGDDLRIVAAARVSYDGFDKTGEDLGRDKRLLRYLWTHRHTSPFEQVVLTMRVKAPIFIARQWMRHRTWSYNEVSARYTELPEEYYVPRPEHVGTASKDNKQDRVFSEGKREDAERHSEHIRKACDEAWGTYRSLLDEGVPRELARAVLPLGTYTEFVTTVNLRNLLHFIELRDEPGAQWEIRQYANAILEDIIKPHFPWVYDIFTEGRNK